jgi:serine/threonine protein kinase/DNA-binding winged helix-turn-helix (wHTH) protein
MSSDRTDKLVRFGPFKLDLATADLYRAERKVRLPEQQFGILEMLLRAKGDLVSREEIRKRLWPNDTIVEFDSSINSTIKKLRAALGDSADQPRFIETFARRGYRIMVEVQFPEVAPAVDVTRKAAGGDLVGQRISHYRLLQILGGGGMGVVFRAEDIKLGRAVALKFLPPELADDPAARERFEREARAASSLNHPNICTIYEIDEHNGQPFIAMELLEGCTLRELLPQADAAAANGPAPPLQVQSLMDFSKQIAAGLAAAHGKGIIHRDIKPANIFVTTHGQVKILDFGLAKLHQPDSESQPEKSLRKGAEREWNPLLTLTRTGVTIGTAAYMSPEQVRGEQLDPRTDLFSFGLVMYEMATGQRAFSGETAPVLHDAILNHIPQPPRELNPHVPAKVENIIRKLMAKDRELRYQTSLDLLSELETLSRAMKPQRTRWWAGAAALAGILIIATTWFAVRKPQAPSAQPELRLRQLTTNSNDNPVLRGAISPDGKYLEFSDTEGLHIKLVESSEILTIPQPEELKNQRLAWDKGFWFPDSSSFVVTVHPSIEELREWSSSTASIWKVSVLATAPLKLRDHAVAWAISPDGSDVSFGTNKAKLGEREAWLMGPSGERARKAFEADDSRTIDHLRWSPDGTRYLYALLDQAGAVLVSRDVSGGTPVTLLQPAEMERISDMVWLRDGKVIYDWSETYTQGAVCNYWKLRLDLKTGKRIEGPTRVTNWPDVCMNWPDICITSGSLTKDETKMTFARSSEFITTYIADIDNRPRRLSNYRHYTLVDTNQFVGHWAPDGKSAYVFDYLDHFRLLKKSLDGGSVKTIIPSLHASWVHLTALSPDGKWFIARVWPEDHPPVSPLPEVPFPLVRFPLAGGPPETIMQLKHPIAASCTQAPYNSCVIAELSDDHRQMIVTAFDPIKGRGPEVARFDLDQNGDIHAERLVCALSPDGAMLALRRSPDGPIEVHSLREHATRIIPSSGSPPTVVFRWAANSQGLFVTRKIPSGSELVYMDLQGHTASLHSCLGISCIATVSPDGHHLAVTEEKKTMNMWMMENF